jgi:hypothetical protein
MLPDPADQARRQLDFLLKLGPALMVVRGMQSAEVEDTYRRAADLGIGLGDDAATFKAKWGLWLNATIKRKTALGRERARELVTLAQRSSDGELLLEAYHCRWSTAFFRGDVAEALDTTLVGVETYDLARHRHLGHAFGGHDPGVCAHVVRANALQLSGDVLGRTRPLGEDLRSPRRSVIPTLLAMRFTMPAWLTNSAASVRLPSRPRNAPRTWPRNLRSRLGALAAWW